MPYGLPQFLSKRIFRKKKDESNKNLSYQSLRCVLEYLEANRRIYVTARCPDLQNTERTIPLHIDSVILGESQIALNDVYYVFQELTTDLDSDGQRIYSYDGIDYKPYLKTSDRFGLMTPGDILMKSHKETEQEVLTNHFRFHNSLNRINITFRNGPREVDQRILPDSIQLHVAMKKLTSYLFGRRCYIRVKTIMLLEEDTQILRLPVGLQFYVEGLLTENSYIESLRLIIKKESFPLGILVSHRIVIEPAVMLVLEYPTLKNSFALANEEVCSKWPLLWERGIVAIAKHTLNCGRSIGTCYEFNFDESKVNPSFSTILALIKEQNIPGITENWIKSTDKPRKHHLQSISFPISATSKLDISVRKIVEDVPYTYVGVEVVPIVVVEPGQKRIGSRFLKLFSNFSGFFVNKN